MKKSKINRFLSAVLAMLMVVTMFPVTVFAAEGDTATLVTNVSDLAVGDKVVIVAKDYDVALSTNQKTNNRGEAAITRSGNTITLTADVQVLTLESGAKEGTFAFNTGSGYLYAAGKSKAQNGSSNKNHLKTEETLSDNSSWKIEISNNATSVVAQGENGCNTILYNNSNKLFSAYVSDQSDIQIYKLGEAGGSTDVTVGTPTASVAAGAVEAGTKVAFSAATEGATVKYSTDNGASWTDYTGEIEITEAVTFQVKAVKDGVESSVATFAYTIKVEEPEYAIPDGDYVIWAPAYNKALSSQKTGNYNLGVDVVATGENKLYGPGTTEIWTIKNNEDGTITISYSGQNLGMADSYSSMNLGAVNDKWEVIELNNNLYNVKNVARGNFIEWYAQYSNWSTYNSYSAATDGQFQLRFTPASEITAKNPEQPEDPTEPEVQYAEKLTELPGNGDVIIIYNSGNAMGSAANGKKLEGVAAEVAENKLPIAEGMAQLLVTVDGDNYIFTLDGKYLTSATTGNGLSFADELTDCGKWTFEVATNGTWYIKNVGANYKGTYNQAIEYYSGFTTYGIKETTIYQMELFLVSEARKEGIVTELKDGDTVVIFNPSNMVALSTSYNGFYNNGVAVTNTNGKLSGYTKAEIWTVGVNEDGTYTFSTADGKKFSMGASYASTPLDDINTAWEISEAATADCLYIKNAVRGNYIEWYASKNNWSSYYKISEEELFAQQFYLVIEEDSEEDALPSAGDKVVIYNLSAQGVLGAENDTQSIENVEAVIWEYDDAPSTAQPENGGVIFTVSKNGEYFRFYNEAYGYLCSNGTGNNAFYSQEASDDADWKITEGKSGGWNLESRTAKYNGTYSQFLEYYADSYKTYSMYNVTDYDIYEFFFYPLEDGVGTYKDIVHNPAINVLSGDDGAYIGQDWVVTFEFDSAFPMIDGTLSVKFCNHDTESGNVTEICDVAATGPVSGVYTVTVPAEQVAKATGDAALVISAKFEGNKELEHMLGAAIIDEPSIGTVTPASNAQTGDDKRPVISAEIINEGENATVTMTVNGEAVDAKYENGKITYTPSTDMEDGKVSVRVDVKRADGKETYKAWSFTVGKASYQLYFGQLHSHTTYSDGSGSLESALEYIKGLPESANVDFVAFTDHSNYFDASGAANPEGALYDMSLATANSQTLWSEYKGTIADFNASQTDVIAIGGFEMTWSGGPGHINTFNTEGIVSRNNTTLNNKTSDAGMKAYYALLSQAEGIDSLSQFNHPGSTFGTFTDFAYWDAVIDTRIQMVEVGNGEGQIGAGGYYPSYEYYTMALDKGWHVAPTNNQDNHKGKWGNGNDARDVILTDDFTEEGIYQAIRDMRMYATEDKNLEITYTVNNQLLGSIIEEVPEKLNIEVSVYDPDNSDSISKVEVIVNSGKTAYVWDNPAVLASGNLSVELDPTYSYYYIKVTQGDGDLAVTAPVWVGESLKLGISSVECGTSTPVTGEELTLTTTLFNSEKTDATVKTITYDIKGGENIGTDNTGYTLSASGTLAVDFVWTPKTAKVTTITVTAVVEQDGVEYTFTMDVELDVQDANKLVYIGIDASHYNEYVAGNYKDSMGNFGNLAAEYSVRTVELKTSEDLIAACSNPKYKALILTAPSRRLAAAQSDPKSYTEAELEAIKAFNANGGIVILAGWSDNYENYDVIQSNSAIKHMAETQNDVLEALGSSLRIADDATYDDVRSAADGVDKWRLYFNTYGESFLTEGVEVDPENPYDRLYTEVFSHYGGASIYTVGGTLPSTVSPVVFGHNSTYSVDVDKDGLGGNDIPKYVYAEGDSRLMIMATEQLEGQGLIIVSGAAFMSNFEVQATIEDSGSEKNYSNYKICENLLAYINPVTVTSIAEVRAQTEVGYKYTIEGIVTSNASGYDKDTAFFDCIYVQDATGGICCFPVAGNYKAPNGLEAGDKVRITGTTEFYQGEPELQVTSIEVIGTGFMDPTVVTAAQINDRSAEGKLITLKGTVVSFEYANGLIQTIMVKDAKGNVARVFIDGYITTDEDVKNLKVGSKITVTGIASYDDTFNAPEGPFPRIRVRNRADIVCENTAKHVTTVADGDNVVIFNIAYEKAIGTENYTYTNNGNSKDEIVAIDGTIVGNILSYKAGTAVFTVSIDENGHYTFISQDGKYLYLDGTNVRLVDERGEYTLFDLEEAEGGFYIRSINANYKGKPQYLEYYNGYFTCYSLGSDTTKFVFGMFVEEKPQPNPAPDNDEDYKDQIIITIDRSDEANPETGAPVENGFSVIAGIAVLSAAAFVLGKRK